MRAVSAIAALLEVVRSEGRDARRQDGETILPFVDTLLAAFPGRPAVPVANRAGGQARQVALVEPLSPRELDVLRLLAAGRSNAELARDLVVGEGTVKSHLIHIYGKLGVHSRTQAVARARALRLLD